MNVWRRIRGRVRAHAAFIPLHSLRRCTRPRLSPTTSRQRWPPSSPSTFTTGNGCIRTSSREFLRVCRVYVINVLVPASIWSFFFFGRVRAQLSPTLRNVQSQAVIKDEEESADATEKRERTDAEKKSDAQEKKRQVFQQRDVQTYSRCPQVRSIATLNLVRCFFWHPLLLHRRRKRLTKPRRKSRRRRSRRRRRGRKKLSGSKLRRRQLQRYSCSPRFFPAGRVRAHNCIHHC